MTEHQTYLRDVPLGDDAEARLLARVAAREATGSDELLSEQLSAAESCWDEWLSDGLETDCTELATSYADYVPSVYSYRLWEQWSQLGSWVAADELLAELGADEQPLSELATGDGRRGLEALAVLVIYLQTERAILAYCETMAEQCQLFADELEQCNLADQLRWAGFTVATESWCLRVAHSSTQRTVTLSDAAGSPAELSQRYALCQRWLAPAPSGELLFDRWEQLDTPSSAELLELVAEWLEVER